MGYAYSPLWAIILAQFKLFEDIESRVYGLVAATDGIQWTFALAFILFSMLFTFARWLRTFFLSDTTEAIENARGTWRLIINPWMNVCLNVIILVSTLFVVLNTFSRLGLTIDYPFDDALYTIPTAGITGSVALFALVVVPLLLEPIRAVLDLANDILTYVQQNEGDENFLAYLISRLKTYGAAFFNSQETSTEGDVSGDGEKDEIEKEKNGTEETANGIRSRFTKVIDHLVKVEKVSKLVVIAHSQGSVIALDELRDPEKGIFDTFNNEITLITIGSPISHLYQKYFPDTYPPWKDENGPHPHWHIFFYRLSKWRHYYRVDDYIGLKIDDLPASVLSDEEEPKLSFRQYGIGIGGHSKYWSDLRFVQAVKKEMF